MSSWQLSRPAVLSICTRSAWFSRCCRPSHQPDRPHIPTVLQTLIGGSWRLVFHSASSVSPSVRRVPPRFSIPPTDNEIMPGGSVNITCVAVGSPMPYVKWMLGAEDLTPEDDMPIGRNVLELTDVRQSANYTCVAMSTLGVIEAMAQITVKGKQQPSQRTGFKTQPIESIGAEQSLQTRQQVRQRHCKGLNRSSSTEIFCKCSRQDNKLKKQHVSVTT